MILKRTIAVFIDLSLAAVLSIVLSFALSLFKLPWADNAAFVFGSFGFVLKDLFRRKRSIGKELLGLKITFKSNKYVILKLIIRNITLFIWPIEFILLCVIKKRIGDILAGSRVN